MDTAMGSWPTPPAGVDGGAETLFKARVEFEIERRLKELDAISAERISNSAKEIQAVQAEDRLREAVQSAYLTSAAQAVDRSVKRAELVVKTAATIGTVQTGLTALFYRDSTTQTIPAHVMIPMIAIACSIGLAAGYLGYLGKRTIDGDPLVASMAPKQQAARLSLYIAWINTTVFARVALLRLAVLALSLGIGLMPTALIPDPPLWIYVTAGLVAGVALLVEVCRAEWDKT